MNSLDLSKLDNPIWYSLTEYHQKFAVGNESIKFYHPDFAPFGGFINQDNSSNVILEYSKLVNNFFVVGQKPEIPQSLKINFELKGLQMVLSNKIDSEISEPIIKLSEEHFNDLIDLVKLVYPEYFKQKTIDLGNYYGIYKENKLVSITGERMQMKDFTEISAVITHPEHTGNGYAQQLISHTANSIFDNAKMPFLHVSESNSRAIKVYEKLGFVTRKKMSFWNISKF